MLLSERGWRQEHCWLFGCGYCQPLCGVGVVVCDDFPPSLALRGCLSLCGLSVVFVLSPSLRPSPSPFTLLRFAFLFEVVFVAGVAGRSGRPTVQDSERRKRELNDRQRAYVVWAATPPAQRDIGSLDEFCEAVGVSRQAVWKWSKDPRVVEAIRFCTLQNAGSPEKIQAVLDMVYEQAMERRDVKMAEIWMRAAGVMGQFGRASDLLVEVADDLAADDISGLSLEELARVRDLALQDKADVVAVELANRERG